MKKYTIEPVCLGFFTDFEQSKFTFGRNYGVKVDVPLNFWIVKGADGVILVDSGSDVSEEAARRHHLPIKACYTDVRQALAEHEVDPLDVKEIILSHLHWDHCYHLELFPNAVFYAQRREVEYAIAPLDAHLITYERNEAEYPPVWLPYVNRINMLQGDCELREGIGIVTLPGHTKGLQGVLVDTLQGQYLISSDAFPMYENFESKLPPGIHIDLEVCYATIEKAHALTDKVLPSHDARVLDQRIYGAGR